MWLFVVYIVSVTSVWYLITITWHIQGTTKVSQSFIVISLHLSITLHL